MNGPRQPSGRRAAAGPRAPAAARRTRGTTGSGRASHPPLRAGGDPEREPDAADEQVAPAPELSTWQLLLHQFDAFLRDPRLTNALRASMANLSAGVRGLGAATREAVRQMARALRRIRVPFPRRLLLALLALALPLALLALLSSSDDERSTRSATEQRQPPAAEADGGLSLPGVGMPDLLPAPAKVPRVRVALVLDANSYDPAALRGELRALGTWLADNHAPGTRVSLIDADSGRASAPLRAAQLATARAERPRPSTKAAIRSAFGRQKRRRLLVTLGAAVTPPGRATTLAVDTRRGAGAGSGAALRRGRRSRVTIDERRPNALAANVARAIMAISGQRERR